MATQNIAISCARASTPPSVWGYPVKGNHGNDRNRPWENSEGSSTLGCPRSRPAGRWKIRGQGGTTQARGPQRRTDLSWVCRPRLELCGRGLGWGNNPFEAQSRFLDNSSLLRVVVRLVCRCHREYKLLSTEPGT